MLFPAGHPQLEVSQQAVALPRRPFSPPFPPIFFAFPAVRVVPRGFRQTGHRSRGSARRLSARTFPPSFALSPAGLLRPRGSGADAKQRAPAGLRNRGAQLVLQFRGSGGLFAAPLFAMDRGNPAIRAQPRPRGEFGSSGGEEST